MTNQEKIAQLKVAILDRDVRVRELSEVLAELLDLCALGDVDEETEMYGWGETIKKARALLPTK